MLARPLTSDFSLSRASLPSHFHLVELLVEHQGLLHDREIQSLALLRLEVVESLLLEQTLAKDSLASSFFLFALAIVPDVHQVLRALSLGIDLFQYSLLVALQDTEARLERLEHTRILVLDAFGQNQGVKSSVLVSVTCITSALIRPSRPSRTLLMGGKGISMHIPTSSCLFTRSEIFVLPS